MAMNEINVNSSIVAIDVKLTFYAVVDTERHLMNNSGRVRE